MREKLVAEASTSRGQKYGRITLATGGPPIHVEIKKPQIEEPRTASSDALIRYMHDQNFSLNRIKVEQKFIRKIFGEDSVETHSHSKIEEATHHTDEFFEVCRMQFEEKIGKTSEIKIIERPVVFVKNTVALVGYLLDRMELDEEIIFLKNGIDDGGGFLKFCLLIVNKENNWSANSVKDVIILAVVPGVKESYKNVLTLWNLVGMDEIEKLKLAADLKIYNIVLGIGSHSSSHSCYICDAKNPFAKGVNWPKGNMRTLKSIRDNFDAWKRAGSKKDRAKDFKNCTNLPMFKMEDKEGKIRTVDLVPPCELHLLLGPVNHMLEELEKVWSEAGFWVSGSNAYKRGQDHGKLNGNGCNQLLKEENLIHLVALLPDGLSDYGDAFRAFAKVVQGCYSYKVSATIKEDIQKFQDAYLKLNISITPKVHIVFEHLYDFLADSNASNSGEWIGLAMYSEQAFEAIHHSFKKRWENFKVNPDNENYDKKILRAVCCFNGLNTY